MCKINISKKRRPLWAQIQEQKLDYDTNYPRAIEEILEALELLCASNVITKKKHIYKYYADIAERIQTHLTVRNPTVNIKIVW